MKVEVYNTAVPASQDQVYSAVACSECGVPLGGMARAAWLLPQSSGGQCSCPVSCNPDGGLLGDLGGLVAECKAASDFSLESFNNGPCKAGVFHAPNITL